ncbi:MAG TPA: MFS transporter, partial [Thiothrix sp.]|nr:MFS transporter [Thiothrix sp.]
MNKQEWYTASSLSAVYAVRMLGLFMILPVLPLYAKSLADVTPFMVGVAIGVYGLTQALFQIPLGFLSDKIGRKPVIIGGLALFAVGSVVAALSTSIEWIAVGRALQGMGAIAAATMALAADLTRETHRAKVMSVIGLTIAISFSLAMIIGPIIDQWAGLSGIFWVTTALALFGILLVLFVVPNPQQQLAHRDAGIMRSHLGDVLRSHALWRMNIGVFFLHLIMTANFSVLPLIFSDSIGLDNAEHWQIYLPVFVFAFFLAIPLIIIAEKYQKIRRLFLLAVGLLLAAQAGMAFLRAETLLLLLAFFIFFIGFNFLEAVQPSLVAKYAKVDSKGTAMGVFSTAQFLGIFVGG